jgi:hypothetical protein
MADPSPAHLRLAGMALAHALWSIEYGDTLCTLAMLEDGEGKSLARYEADSIPESLQGALTDLRERLTGGTFAAVVYDGYYTPDSGDERGERRDALIVELLAATPPSASGNTAAQVGRIAQQYLPGSRSLLRRRRVKLAGRPYPIAPLPPAAAELVIEGALDHEKVRELFEEIAAATV